MCGVCRKTDRQTETERERQTQTHRHTQTHTHRQTHTGRHTDTHRQTDRHTHTLTCCGLGVVAVSEELDEELEELDGDGLTDILESLSVSLATPPFCWGEPQLPGATATNTN